MMNHDLVLHYNQLRFLLFYIRHADISPGASRHALNGLFHLIIYSAIWFLHICVCVGVIIWIHYYAVRWTLDTKWSCENRYVLFFGSFSDLVNQEMLQINSLNVIGSKWSCLRAKVCSPSGQSHSAAWAFALLLRDPREEIGFAREHKRQQQLICFPHLRAENWKKVSASEFCDDDVHQLRFQPFFSACEA